MNGIGQQAKGYVSPSLQRSRQIKTNVYTKNQIQVFLKYMYVNYMICKAFIKAYKL